VVVFCRRAERCRGDAALDAPFTHLAHGSVADPYLNTDAGTMSPFEHGEVFVLDDGGEVRAARPARLDAPPSLRTRAREHQQQGTPSVGSPSPGAHAGGSTPRR
jgi:hypothetical protein